MQQNRYLLWGREDANFLFLLNWVIAWFELRRHSDTSTPVETGNGVTGDSTPTGLLGPLTLAGTASSLGVLGTCLTVVLLGLVLIATSPPYSPPPELLPNYAKTQFSSVLS